MTDARGLERPERPDGAISGLLHDHHVRIVAATTHATHEGYAEIDVRDVLEAYDRNEHPWMHGRRPYDLAERLRDWLSRLAADRTAMEGN